MSLTKEEKTALRIGRRALELGIRDVLSLENLSHSSKTEKAGRQTPSDFGKNPLELLPNGLQILRINTAFRFIQIHLNKTNSVISTNDVYKVIDNN